MRKNKWHPVFKRNDSPYFWFSVKIDGRPRVMESTQSIDHKQAINIYTRRRSELLDVKNNFAVARIKLSELISKYMEIHASGKMTAHCDEITLRQFRAVWGDIQLAQITIEKISKFRADQIKEGKMKSTINRKLAILKTAMNMARNGLLVEEWKGCCENPFLAIKFYKEKEFKRDRILTQEETGRLFKELRPLMLKRIVFFAYCTGMRQNEILRCKWTDIDYQKKQITVLKRKTGDPLVAPLFSELEAELKMMPSVSEYVFGTEKGRRVSWRRYRTRFLQALERANIDGFWFRDLRHCFASWLKTKGTQLDIIQGLLGHSNINQTQTYVQGVELLHLAAVETLPKGLMSCYADVTLPKSDNNIGDGLPS